MGQTTSLDQMYQSNSPDDNDQVNQAFRGLIYNFKVFQSDQVNNHYGKFQLLQQQQNMNFFIVLKDILLTSREDFENHKQHWEMRCQQYVHTNVIQVHALYKTIDEHMCGSTFKISLMIDFIQSSMEEEIKTRPDQFKEDEIWILIDSLIGGLAFLQSKGMRHGNISLDTIYAVNNVNNKKLYKVADEQLMSYSGLYNKVLQNLMNPAQNNQSQQMIMPGQIQANPLKGIYLSPLLLKNLINKDQPPIHNSFKSDVFSLGVNLLHLILWAPMDDLYDLKNLKIDEVFLVRQYNKLRELQFSNDLYFFLQEMLQTEENFRPDFIQLDQKLNLLPFLQGKRIAQCVQPIQLLNIFPPIQRQIPMQMQMDPLLQQQQQQGILSQQPINQSQQQQQFRSPIFGNDITNNTNNRTIFGDSNQNRNIYANMGSGDPNKSFLLMDQNKQANFGTVDQQQQIFGQQPQQDPLGVSRLNNQLNYSQLNQQQQVNPIFGTNQNLATGAFNSVQNQQTYQQSNMLNNPSTGLQNNNYNSYNQNNFQNQQQQQQQQFLQQQQQQMVSPYGSFIGGQNIPLYNGYSPQFGQMSATPMGMPNMGMGCAFCHHGYGFPMMHMGNQFPMHMMPQQMMFNQQYSPMKGSINNRQKERGKLTYEDGSIYEGESFQGQREGFGKLVFPDGVYYEGMWVTNKMQGKGILYYASGEKAYEGDWFDNKFNNFGHLYNNQAKVLEGPFDYSNFNKIQDFWQRYEGDFKMDMKDGFGTIYFTNGEHFSGTFVNDMIHGYGTYTTLENVNISGVWENNILQKQN